MAGATNKAMKAAGLPAKSIETVRVARGSGLSVQSAIQHAQAHGLPMGKAKSGDLTGWQKAAAGVKATPAERVAALERPGVDRMRASKANVATLREQRDARRANMKRMRKRVEFARETKQLRAAFTPEHQRAIDKAEMGYGPNAALRSARTLQRRAVAEVRAARSNIAQVHHSFRGGQEAANARIRLQSVTNDISKTAMKAHAFLKDAPRLRGEIRAAQRHLEDAAAFRGDAQKERQHARLVKDGYAIRDMLDTASSFRRAQIKKETGYRSKTPTNTSGTTPRFSQMKHLAKRVALTEAIANRWLNSSAAPKNAGERFSRGLAALERLGRKKK